MLPVGFGSAARAAAEGPIVTTAALGFAAVAVAAAFCSGFSAPGAPGRDRGVGVEGWYGSARPISPGGRNSGPIQGLS